MCINNTREHDEYITADILSSISSMSYNDILLRLHDVPDRELVVWVDFAKDLTEIQNDQNKLHTS